MPGSDSEAHFERNPADDKPADTAPFLQKVKPADFEPKSLEPKMATELCFHVISCSWFPFAFGLVFLEGPCSLVGAPLLLLVFWFGFQLLNVSNCLYPPAPLVGA